MLKQYAQEILFRSTSLRSGQTIIYPRHFISFIIQIHQPQERLDRDRIPSIKKVISIQIHQPQERLDRDRIPSIKKVISIQIHQPQERLDAKKLTSCHFPFKYLDPLASGEARQMISTGSGQRANIQIHQPQERLDKALVIGKSAFYIQIHQPQERLDLHMYKYGAVQLIFRSTSIRKGQTVSKGRKLERR